MNGKELEIMLTIKGEGTVAKAATVLGIHRSSITRQVKKVEEKVGTPLFYTTSQGLVPTFGGELYLKTAESMLAEYQVVLQELQSERFCQDRLSPRKTSTEKKKSREKEGTHQVTEEK